MSPRNWLSTTAKALIAYLKSNASNNGGVNKSEPVYQTTVDKITHKAFCNVYYVTINTATLKINNI